MKKLLSLALIVVGLLSCSKRKIVNEGTYIAYFYDTEWTLKIKGDTFTHLSSGHLGTEIPITGKYKITGDTLILLTDSIQNKFLIDGDSCLIDVELQFDYCLIKDSFTGSNRRSINYPQIPTADITTRQRVSWMLETALNGKEILEYFPDTTKSIVIQEYFELNKTASLRLKSHGTAITFLTSEEIREKQVEEYLIIDELRLGVNTGSVTFQVMPEFSDSILVFFEKINGQWVCIYPR